jgi:hypothetical protein
MASKDREDRPDTRGKLTWDGSHRPQKGSLEWVCHERFTTLLQWQGFRPSGGLPDGSILWEQAEVDASRREMGKFLAYRLDVDHNCEPRWKSLDDAELSEGPSYEEVRSAERGFVELLERDGLNAEEIAAARLEFAHWEPSVRAHLDQLYPARLQERTVELAADEALLPVCDLTSSDEPDPPRIEAAPAAAGIEWCLSGTVLRTPELEQDRAGSLQMRVEFADAQCPSAVYAAVFPLGESQDTVDSLRKGDSIRVLGEAEGATAARFAYHVELDSPRIEVIGRCKAAVELEAPRLSRER